MTQVFAADTKSFGLMIYNARTSKICRTESDFMKNSNFGFIFQNKNYSFEGITIGTYGLTIIGKGKYLFFYSKKESIFLLYKLIASYDKHL